MSEEKKGFLAKTWSVISYPFRTDGFGDDITNTSLFPFKRTEELLRQEQKTEAEKAELAKLMEQNDRIADGGYSEVAKVAGVRAVENTKEAVKELGNNAMEAITPKIPFLPFLKDHWQSIAAIIAAITIGFSTGGIFGSLAMFAALAIVANDVVKTYTGKGIIEHVTGFLIKKDSSPAHEPTKEKQITTPEVARADLLVPENPHAFPNEEMQKWTAHAHIRKPVGHAQ